MRAVDLFAGAGGFSTGAAQAGARVVWAANHWPLAVEAHRANHPGTVHACQDLRQADWTTLPAYDLLLASPACQGHSLARGKERPHHDALRATAWAVIDCAEVTRPRALAVENVPAMREWTLYPLWREALVRLGYDLTEQILDSAEFGAPQERQRLFVVGVRGGRAPAIRSPRLAPVPAASLIEWGAPTTQIDRPGRSKATLRRIAAGRARFGPRFLTSYYGSTRDGRELARPLGTVTTRDRWALIDGDRMRMLSPGEYRAAMGFPSTYLLPGNRAEQIHLLGNAVVVPVAREVVRQISEVA